MVSEPMANAIEALCRKWHVKRLWLFGSTLSAPESARDIDLLYQFDTSASTGLFAFDRMQSEFEAALGKPVDLVSREAVQRSENWIRREAILSSARLIYDS